MTVPIPADGGLGDAGKISNMEDGDFAAFIGLDKVHPETPAAPVDGPARDAATGKFVKATDEKPVEEAVAVEDTPETPVLEAEKPAEPVKPDPDARPPLTKFDVFDKDGNKVDAQLDYKLSYKVDGKIIENPLDKVVHLAQQSTFNARQVQELNQGVQTSQQENSQLRGLLEQYEQHLAQMFDNEALYLKARDTYAQANSPEQRAAVAEAKLQSERRQYNEEREQGQVAQWSTGTIQPALQELAKTYPSVTEEDLLGRLALAIGQYQVAGRVPLANMPKVHQWVTTDLAEWAKSAHSSRTQAFQQASSSLDKDRAAAQSKQRQVGKALAPVGGTAATAPKPKPITKASDVFNDPLFGGPQK